MRLVIQRVSSAKVSVDNEIVGQIGKGYVILCGVKKRDSREQTSRLAEKVLHLRIMPARRILGEGGADEDRKMNYSILDVQGEILAISQFTLYSQTQGRRPGFTDAEEPEKAKQIFDVFVEELKNSKLNIQTGKFGHYMLIEMVNDGPVTIILEG